MRGKLATIRGRADTFESVNIKTTLVSPSEFCLDIYRDNSTTIAISSTVQKIQVSAKSLTMAQQFLPNTMPLQPLEADTKALLKQSLEEIVQQNPPLEKYSEDDLGGLVAGYTGLAYLFLQMAHRHPQLQIQGHDCNYWAGEYLKGDRGTLELDPGNCGFVSEKLALAAIKACFSKDEKDVAALLDNVPDVVAPDAEGVKKFPSEMIYGRTAMLYMLRLVKKFVPSSTGAVDEAITKICQRVLDTKDNDQGHWLWNGRHYYGAAHGDIGIITQIVLSEPSLAPRLAARVEELLDLQTDAGNWYDTDAPREDTATNPGRVQYCHGAPGFIFCLQSLRPFYPALHDRIDAAIAKAREITWTNGILVKEPSLCHGLFGNGL